MSRMAISKAVKASLAGAVHGKKIDLDHPAVQKYISKETGTGGTNHKPISKPAKRDPREKKPAQPKPTPTPRQVRPNQTAAQEFENLTLREIVSRFGTSSQFKDYLVAWKTLADIRLKELQLKERNGELIPKSFVRVHVFAILDGLNKRLLMDTPKTITAQVQALIKSEAEEVEVTKAVHDLISAQLSSVSKKVKRNLSGSNRVE